MPRFRPRSPSFHDPVPSPGYQLLNEFKDRLGSETLSPELAHQLFGKLLRQPVKVPERALNGFFSALARAPPSIACPDGPALAIALFKQMARAGQRPVTAPTIYTYSILIDCCHRARRPDLGPAFFGHLLKTGITADVITFNNLFKCLGDMKRTEEALDVLLHKMPDDLPNVISYSIILKGFCNNGRSQRALDLLRMMRKKDMTTLPTWFHTTR
jgi:pentatricopeptide repeat protein